MQKPSLVSLYQKFRAECASESLEGQWRQRWLVSEVSASVGLEWGLHACMLSSFSRFWFFVTTWTVDRQDPPSIGFSRQEHRSGLLCPPPGDLPNPGTELSYVSTLAGRFFTTSTTLEAQSGALRICISNKFPAEVNEAGQGITLWQAVHCPYTTATSKNSQLCHSSGWRLFMPAAGSTRKGTCKPGSPLRAVYAQHSGVQRTA